MSISSVASASIQPAIFNTSRAEGAVEGNKPDNDGDQDDAVSTTSTQPVASSSPEGSSSGTQLDVFA